MFAHLRSRKTIVFSALCLGLAGCSYFDVPPENGKGETIDLTTNQVVEQPREDISSMSAPQPGSSLEAIPRPATNSNIEVYSLDGPAYVNPNAPRLRRPVGQPQTRGGAAPIKLRPPSEFKDEQSSLLPRDRGPTPLLGERFEARSEEPVSQPELKTKPKMAEAPKAVPVADVSATVLFEHSETDVKASDAQKLSKLAQSIKAQEQQNVVVEGHASKTSRIEDPLQRQIANMKISMERAFNVAKLLIQNGVPTQQLQLRANGEANASADDQSRRVDVKPASSTM